MSEDKQISPKKICSSFIQAPKCPNCGNFLGLVSKHQRWCESCDSVFEISESEKYKYQFAKLPKEFTEELKQRLKNFGHY